MLCSKYNIQELVTSDLRIEVKNFDKFHAKEVGEEALFHDTQCLTRESALELMNKWNNLARGRYKYWI